MLQKRKSILDFHFHFIKGIFLLCISELHTLSNTHTHCKGTDVKPDSQGKQLRHVTEAVVGQRADLVVTQVTEKETITDT